MRNISLPMAVSRCLKLSILYNSLLHYYNNNLTYILLARDYNRTHLFPQKTFFCLNVDDDEEIFRLLCTHKVNVKMYKKVYCENVE